MVRAAIEAVPGDDWPEDSQTQYNIDAEMWVLGAMLNHPSAVAGAAEILTADSFWRPAHRELFQAMMNMYAARLPVDPVSVWAWLEQDGNTAVLGGKGANYLHDLMALRGPGAIGYHARIVSRCATRRAVAEVGSRLIAESGRYDLDEAELVGRSRRMLDKIITTAAIPGLDMPLWTADEVCDSEDSRYPEVIPGLVDALDRVVVVGPEGAGKSILGLQVGFAKAVGVHPFQWRTAIEPGKVLLVDLENPPGIVQRRFRRMREIAATYPGWDGKRLELLHRPGGLNLAEPRDAYLLARAIEQAKPVIVLAGPIYKMMTGADIDLATHAKVAAFWDKIREYTGIALWLEAHAPYGGPGKREMRPEGSNLWAKWPEFRISLNWATKAHGGDRGGLDVSQFGGHREEGRPWPSWLTRNAGPGWPWQANYDEHVFDAPLPLAALESGEE
jgi:DnaB-like helicase N terminal domain/AAA domain